MFFRSKQLAMTFAKRHALELVPIQALIVRWLAKNRSSVSPEGGIGGRGAIGGSAIDE